MKKQRSESLKLGLFVLTGLLMIITTLYIVGKNKGMFSNSFELKTQFKAVNGLLAGNNVRFAGIDVGTVTSVDLLSDTVVVVTMSLETRMRKIVHNNALASLGSDGLIGDRVVNLSPGEGEALLAISGDLLPSKEEISTEAMLQTLHKTNENIAIITDELRATVHSISASTQLSSLLSDKSLSDNLKASLVHLHETTEKASNLMTEVSQTISLASNGKGTLATILTDTSLAFQISEVVQNIKTVSESADKLVVDLNQVVTVVNSDLNVGNGTLNALMKDSIMANRLRMTMDNVEQGAAAFNQNMEALKHNFLLRRYFKKQGKKQKEKM